uniref:Uncharacterized protein n=1 Tax=Anguilla anguilla TaxID=7936 RepID=A0A0E9QVN4_ANGAN
MLPFAFTPILSVNISSVGLLGATEGGSSAHFKGLVTLLGYSG